MLILDSGGNFGPQKYEYITRHKHKAMRVKVAFSVYNPIRLTNLKLKSKCTVNFQSSVNFSGIRN